MEDAMVHTVNSAVRSNSRRWHGLAILSWLPLVTAGPAPGPERAGPFQFGDDAAVRDQDRQFWSFRPLSGPGVPRTADRSRLGTPVDAFLLSRLESKKLTFSPNADRATLLRRASLDLL